MALHGAMFALDSANKLDHGASIKDLFVGNDKQYIVMLLAGSAVLIFVQHVRSGKAQDGKQFIAIGVVGFMLLFLAEFAPEIAFGFAALFFLIILLNSPNGIPVVSSNQKVS